MSACGAHRRAPVPGLLLAWLIGFAVLQVPNRRCRRVVPRSRDRGGGSRGRDRVRWPLAARLDDGQHSVLEDAIESGVNWYGKLWADAIVR